MNKKPNTQQKYVNAITELWNENHFKVFHYTKAKLIMEKFHLPFNVLTNMVKTGVLEPCDKSYYKFNRQPSKQDAHMVYEANLQAARASYSNRKGKEATRPHSIPEAERKLAPINEELCINYLKERGYKVMKPETKYIEL